mgnify:CR=1 FL=1
MLHIALHFFVPGLVSATFYRQQWLKTYLLMMSGMLIDIDHLLADPIYDPMRCSIGFHPLHTWLPIGIYVLLLTHPRTRLVGIGLCIHIALDAADCL